MISGLETHIQGIPCLIEVTRHIHQPAFRGPSSLCDSDMDYYGYDEIEFEVRDRKGYRAAWLERKLTDADVERIEVLIKERSKD